MLKDGGELVLIGPTAANAKEIYEYNARLTGTPIDPITFIRTDRLRQEIEALGGLSASTSSEVLKSDHNFKLLDAVSISISIIAIAMGALNVLNALVMATQERTHEIGILSAIGWSGRLIMSSIVIEGLLMCAFGCMLGVLLSFLAGYAFPHIPAIGRLISFRPTLALQVPILSATAGLCLLGSLFPAWRAVRLVPAEALRRI